MESDHNFRGIMSNTLSKMGDGIDKIVNDITTTAETTLPVLTELSLQIGFEFLLHTAIASLLY